MGRQSDNPWKMAALCRTVPLSHPRAADAVTFHVWKGFDILFSSLDLEVPHSSPSNTSEELRAACREWAEEIVKPHHNRTTSHIHHPAPHKMFLMMLFAIHLLSPKPKCSYYSRLNASTTTGINRKSFLSFNGCRTMHPLCSDALENYMCAEVRNNR